MVLFFILIRTFIIDKYNLLNNRLWFCCNLDSNYYYAPNLTTSNCFYFNSTLTGQWDYANQFCLGLNQGFTLAILNKNDVFEYAKNLTANTFWVNIKANK